MIGIGIATAGALGALARWGLTALVERLHHFGFPTGTLVVNVVGSFLVGILATLLVERWPGVPLHLRTVLLSGFLGAFTTFSTLAFDSVVLWRGGEEWRAVLNVVATVGLGLTAAAVGVSLALRASS